MSSKMMTIVLALLLILFGSFEFVLSSQQSAKTGKSERPGVPPLDANDCPTTHPIKGNFTT